MMSRWRLRLSVADRSTRRSFGKSVFRDQQRGLPHVHAVAEFERERPGGLVGASDGREQFRPVFLDHPGLVHAKVEGDPGLVSGDEAVRHAIDHERHPLPGRLVELEPQPAVRDGQPVVALDADEVAKPPGLLEGGRRGGRPARRATARHDRPHEAAREDAQQGNAAGSRAASSHALAA
jgi:hypothetical protein